MSHDRLKYKYYFWYYVTNKKAFLLDFAEEILEIFQALKEERNKLTL